MSRCLFIIDPQVDFCSPDGALYVPGADKDMERLADFISKQSPMIDYYLISSGVTSLLLS